MGNSLLSAIDYGKYERWARGTLGDGRRMTIFDADGNVMWGAGPAIGPLPHVFLVESGANDGARSRRLRIDRERTLLYLPVRLNGKELVGWVGMLVDEKEGNASGVATDRAAEALTDIARGIIDDIAQKSDLVKLTEELAQCYEELSFIYDISHEVQARVRQNANVVQALLQTTASRMNLDLAVFVRPRERTCVHAELRSGRIENLDLLLLEIAGDLFRFVLCSAETVVINGEDDPRRAYILPGMMYRIIACPVRSQDTDGLVVLLNGVEKKAFTNSDRRLGEVLASQLSNLVKSEVIIRSMRVFTDQLAAALVESTEAKDPYTRGHSERVNLLAMAIAREIGLSDDELETLHWGSLLHDVGKIGIPDAILCKPGGLTEDEQIFIQVHPQRSCDILQHIEHLKDAMPGVLHHHEMFDGKGYPDRLIGEAIPLHARIIAVADTYDSITSTRAYRSARSHEQALEEIARVAGTQLDPALVDVFRKVCAVDRDWLNHAGGRRDGAR